MARTRRQIRRAPSRLILDSGAVIALARAIALDPEDDRLLSLAARERGVSRSEFIRQQLALVLVQYRRYPKPASAGIIRSLPQRGDEGELFGSRRR